MNYIGSKYSLLSFIDKSIQEVTKYKDHDNLIFADLFAGTGVVGNYYKKKGWKVYSNDIQSYSYIINKHYIENNSKKIDLKWLEYLNNLKPIQGFIYQNYCNGSGSGRMYFSDENGKKCDAIRTKIEQLYQERVFNENNYYFYLGSLINSIDKYANTASVYGAFLKKLKASAQMTFELEPLEIIDNTLGKAFKNDVNDLVHHIQGDVLYLDPPYNSRQYYANYHVLETIAKYDNPSLKGKTGLRNETNQRSDFCSKIKAPQALEHLIAHAKFKYIFLSYNDEGIMSLDTIKKIMSKYGEYSYKTKVHKRYQADKNNNRNILRNETIEYLHCLIKNDFN
ncbi:MULTISPECIES: DNA adenine methylase [unclassified Mycoplasma]|uniref:DNA adenine methylase n=1 Tax=unclassified Mycoplasma TaxID=2683645 RepID=UPI00211B960B|nr:MULTISPECIES: DNA adenine methylase [unclassified Mycoplasma]UUM20108.1 DNA adenine methylase [Mycoplasma sp. 1578d]UUM25088.1 DNA adenine methylase [Mycoplasma sp. 3686d]